MPPPWTVLCQVLISGLLVFVYFFQPNRNVSQAALFMFRKRLIAKLSQSFN